MSGRALTEGVEERVIEGVKVRVYGPTKTVADCFKFRNKIGLDVALEALRDYRRRRRSVDELLRYGEICRVARVMQSIWRLCPEEGDHESRRLDPAAAAQRRAPAWRGVRPRPDTLRSGAAPVSRRGVPIPEGLPAAFSAGWPGREALEVRRASPGRAPFPAHTCCTSGVRFEQAGSLAFADAGTSGANVDAAARRIHARDWPADDDLHVSAEEGQEAHQPLRRDRVSRPRNSSETFGWSMPRRRAVAVCVRRRARSARAMSAASSDFASASAGSATRRSSKTLPLLRVTGALMEWLIPLSFLSSSPGRFALHPVAASSRARCRADLSRCPCATSLWNACSA